MRPLLIGQAPGLKRRPAVDGDEALAGCCERLEKLTGLKGLARRFDRINLSSKYPGKRVGKGDRFPVPDADDLRALDDAVLTHTRVVALGSWVHGFLRGRYRGRAILGIPHPSGLNRLYNDAVVRKLAREVLSLALKQDSCSPSSVRIKMDA